MSLGQNQPVSPPVQADRLLIDFAGTIQRNLSALFQAAHFHVARNGPITSVPKSTDGLPGDILIGKINGNTYLFAKLDRSHWVQFGPGMAL